MFETSWREGVCEVRDISGETFPASERPYGGLAFVPHYVAFPGPRSWTVLRIPYVLQRVTWFNAPKSSTIAIVILYVLLRTSCPSAMYRLDKTYMAAVPAFTKPSVDCCREQYHTHRILSESDFDHSPIDGFYYIPYRRKYSVSRNI